MKKYIINPNLTDKEIMKKLNELNEKYSTDEDEFIYINKYNGPEFDENDEPIFVEYEDVLEVAECIGFIIEIHTDRTIERAFNSERFFEYSVEFYDNITQEQKEKYLKPFIECGLIVEVVE